ELRRTGDLRQLLILSVAGQLPSDAAALPALIRPGDRINDVGAVDNEGERYTEGRNQAQRQAGQQVGADGLAEHAGRAAGVQHTERHGGHQVGDAQRGPQKVTDGAVSAMATSPIPAGTAKPAGRAWTAASARNARPTVRPACRRTCSSRANYGSPTWPRRPRGYPR